jgi:hypothetical protein
MSTTLQSLSAGELLADRPFTDPELSETDRGILTNVLERLRAELGDAEKLRDHPRPLVIFRFEPDGRKVRIVIGDAQGLTAERAIVVVGFLGTKRDGIDCAPLDEMDDELIAGFAGYPGVLSYCSMQQPSGNWANLVLLRDPADMDHWSTSPRHAFAAKAMAPEYYLYIRLHNGWLEGGVLSQNPIVLHKTKYYDFREAIPWRAVRPLVEA